MMINKNNSFCFGKKGLSPVIAVVLLILITVSAGAIIAGFVIPFVRDGLDESTRCVNFKEQFRFEEKIDYNGVVYRYNCIDSGNNKLGFSISSSTVDNESIENIDGFNIVLYGEKGKNKVLKIIDGEKTGNVGILDGNSGVKLNIPKSGEILTYVYNYNSGETYDLMEIYPIIKGDICEISDEIKIIQCNPSGVLNKI